MAAIEALPTIKIPPTIEGPPTVKIPPATKAPPAVQEAKMVRLSAATIEAAGGKLIAAKNGVAGLLEKTTASKYAQDIREEPIIFGDTKAAEYTGVREQLERIARALVARPNKALMANPTPLCEILEKAINQIKNNPDEITPVNEFYLQWTTSKAWACELAPNLTG